MIFNHKEISNTIKKCYINNNRGGNLITIELNQFHKTNCYIIHDNKSCYIIDPGGNKEKIKQIIDEHNLNVLGILLTHAHYDHIFSLDCYDVPIYIHKKELIILENDSYNRSKNHKLVFPFDKSCLNIVSFTNNFELNLNNGIIKAIHTPGHTQGSCCFLFNNNLYSGDTLFFETYGRCDLPTGNESRMFNSLQKLFELDKEIKVFPGHGTHTTIDHEAKRNKFILEH